MHLNKLTHYENSIELPFLQHEFSGFLINSTNPAFNCSQFDQYRSQNLIRGSHICTKPDNGTGTKSKSSLSKGAEAGIGVGVGVAFVLFLMVLLYTLRKKSQSKEKSQTPLHGQLIDTPELPQGRHHEIADFRSWGIRWRGGSECGAADYSTACAGHHRYTRK